ncbi:hypothetical protein ACJMK2_007553 [Sinanodonta woodiana]|uniref:Uncharacterized protein n=1 Tax=Sinanodonta woodiana TaxID=1069815 RepID=A0ABD3VIW2_SINWO
MLRLDLVKELFNSSSPRPFFQDMRKGLYTLGILQRLVPYGCYLPGIIKYPNLPMIQRSSGEQIYTSFTKYRQLY